MWSYCCSESPWLSVGFDLCEARRAFRDNRIRRAGDAAMFIHRRAARA